MSNLISRLVDKALRLSGMKGMARDLEIIKFRVNTLAVIARDRYIRELLQDVRYDDEKRLERHGFKVY